MIFIKRFLLISLFAFFSLQGFAQEVYKNLNLAGFNTDQTFDYIKQFAIENDYFIQKLDRKEGFVQLGFLSKKKNVFKPDFKLLINLLLTPVNQDDSKITLQISAEESISTFEAISYKDIGIVEDKKSYTDFLSLLKQYFDRIKE